MLVKFFGFALSLLKITLIRKISSHPPEFFHFMLYKCRKV